MNERYIIFEDKLYYPGVVDTFVYLKDARRKFEELIKQAESYDDDNTCYYLCSINSFKDFRPFKKIDNFNKKLNEDK